MTNPLPVSLAAPALTSTSTTLGRTRAAIPATESALRATRAEGAPLANTMGPEPLLLSPFRSEEMPMAAPSPPANSAAMMTRPKTTGSATRTEVQRPRRLMLSVGSSQLHRGSPDCGGISAPSRCGALLVVESGHQPVPLPSPDGLSSSLTRRLSPVQRKPTSWTEHLPSAERVQPGAEAAETVLEPAPQPTVVLAVRQRGDHRRHGARRRVGDHCVDAAATVPGHPATQPVVMHVDLSAHPLPRPVPHRRCLQPALLHEDRHRRQTVGIAHVYDAVGAGVLLSYVVQHHPARKLCRKHPTGLPHRHDVTEGQPRLGRQDTGDRCGRRHGSPVRCESQVDERARPHQATPAFDYPTTYR